MNNQLRRLGKRGLTFIEVLIGLTLFAIIFSAATMILMSFVKAHYTVESAPLFRHHVDGVHQFLHSLAQAQPISPNTRPGTRFDWQRVPESEHYNVSFRVDGEFPFFTSDLKPLPPLTAFLRYDWERDYLWLLWFVDTRFTNNQRQLRYSLLSPWISDIEFAYFDSSDNTWTIESIRDEARQRTSQRPEKVYLTFRHQGQTLRRTLNMDNANLW